MGRTVGLLFEVFVVSGFSLKCDRAVTTTHAMFTETTRVSALVDANLVACVSTHGRKRFFYAASAGQVTII